MEKHWHLVEASGRSLGIWTADSAEDALFRCLSLADASEVDEDGLTATAVEGWTRFCADASIACYPAATLPHLRHLVAEEAAAVRCDCCGELRLMARRDVAALATLRDALAAQGIASRLDQTGGMNAALDVGERGVVVSEGADGDFTLCPAWGSPADLEGTGPFVDFHGVVAVVAHLVAPAAVAS